MDNLLFSINAVAPIFIIVFFGIFLKKKNIINDNFTSVSTNVVFKIALPALMFKDVAATDFKSVFDIKLIAYSLAGTVVLFLLLYAVCTFLVTDRQARGAFIQGVFRGNYAIIGIPLAYSAFGQAGLIKGAVLLAFVIPLYNVLAVIVLSVTSPKRDSSKSTSNIFINILTNPLIIAIVLALPFSYFQVQLPQVIMKAVDYMSALAIPLALLGMGGSFSFASIKRNFSLGISAAVMKIAVTPVIFTLVAYYLGFRRVELGVLFILFGAPTAVSSYIMAKAMDSDSDLAANIVLMTTMGSVLTTFAGIYILKTLGLI